MPPRRQLPARPLGRPHKSLPPLGAKKSPNPIDAHVGSRVRQRRLMLGMSQEKLGNSLGLTFQQVQKYEKGANRIGGSRLHQIANILNVTPAFFFEGLATASPEDDTIAQQLTEFTTSLDGVKLGRAFGKLSRPVRQSIVRMVQTLAGEAEDEQAAAHH